MQVLDPEKDDEENSAVVVTDDNNTQKKPNQEDDEESDEEMEVSHSFTVLNLCCHGDSNVIVVTLYVLSNPALTHMRLYCCLR